MHVKTPYSNNLQRPGAEKIDRKLQINYFSRAKMFFQVQISEYFRERCRRLVSGDVIVVFMS